MCRQLRIGAGLVIVPLDHLTQVWWQGSERLDYGPSTLLADQVALGIVLITCR